MNFLAHFYLSGDTPEIAVGNFIADFVKGRNFRTLYKPAVALGIELHRTIDAFTDIHKTVARSKDRLRPVYRHYSAVVVDVFYDHFLAKYWSKFHPLPLPAFAARCYKTVEEHYDVLPAAAHYMFPYMKQGNWLVSYADIKGIERALTGMAKRSPYRSNMELATADLEKNYEAFKVEFFSFFPELKKTCDDFLAKNGFSPTAARSELI